MGSKTGNLISALCLGGFGIYVISAAAELAYTAEVGPGPGFFPHWLGIGLVAFSGLLIFATRTQVEKGERSTTPLAQTAGRALAAWAALMIAIALLGRVGFGLSFVALTIFLILALDRRPPLLAVLVAVSLAVVFHLVFVVALDVSLPRGFGGF